MVLRNTTSEAMVKATFLNSRSSTKGSSLAEFRHHKTDAGHHGDGEQRDNVLGIPAFLPPLRDGQQERHQKRSHGE